MQPNPNPFMSLIPIAAVFVIFYVLLIRPQQKQADEHKKMLENLKKGDKVLTTGGLYATVAGFKGADLELKISDTVKVLAARSAVSQVVKQEQNAASPTGNGVAA